MKTVIQNEEVLVHVNLEGEPCRWICSSTIETGVKCDPGSYRLVVTVEEIGEKRTAVEQTVEVEEPKVPKMPSGVIERQKGKTPHEKKLRPRHPR